MRLVQGCTTPVSACPIDEHLQGGSVPITAQPCRRMHYTSPHTSTHFFKLTLAMMLTMEARKGE